MWTGEFKITHHGFQQIIFIDELGPQMSVVPYQNIIMYSSPLLE